MSQKNCNFYEIYQKANEKFNLLVKEFGATPEGGLWNGEVAQRTRYEQLSKVLDFKYEDVSVCDYGCGYGYYLSYLREVWKGWKGKYIGIDVSEGMIDTALATYGANDEQHVFFAGSRIKEPSDYIVASGVFNLKQDTSDELWKNYILQTIEHFDMNCKKGFAFNALTKYSDEDKLKRDLYYSDPLFLFDYCKRN